MNGDKDNLIRSLRDANEGKQRVICDLIKDCIEKDMEISKLKGRIEFLEKWARWNKGKK